MKPIAENNEPVLLMTSAIDHRGCVASLFDSKTRERQYWKTLKTVFPILRGGAVSAVVYVDNSGWDLSVFRNAVPEDLLPKIEFVALPPDEFDPSRGKSWNEMLAIDKVLATSCFLRDGNPLVLKQTGRYSILNLKTIANDLATRAEIVKLSFFPMLPVKGLSSIRHPPLADTRCMAFRKSLWNREIRGTYHTTAPGIRHVEHIVFETWEKHRGEPGFDFMEHAPLILGKQGSILRFHGIPVPKAIEPAFLIARRIQHVLAFRAWKRKGAPSFLHRESE